MTNTARIERSPGGLGGFTVTIGQRRRWSRHPLATLIDMTGATGPAALKVLAAARAALEVARGAVAVVVFGAAEPETVADSRPRVDYVLPDGTPVKIIMDHGEVPAQTIAFQLKSGQVVLASKAVR